MIKLVLIRIHNSSSAKIINENNTFRPGHGEIQKIPNILYFLTKCSSCGKESYIQHHLVSVVVIFNGVGHEQQIAIARDQWVARGNRSKSQEHKCSHKNRAIWAILSEADNDVTTFQLLFGVLQESNKAFFGALGQNAAGDFHKKLAVDKQSLPGDLNAVSQLDLEAEIGCFLHAHQSVHVVREQAVGVDRGLFWNPHTVALCHKWHVDGMGNIRSTTEARDRVVYSIWIWTCFCYYCL